MGWAQLKVFLGIAICSLGVIKPTQMEAHQSMSMCKHPASSHHEMTRKGTTTYLVKTLNSKRSTKRKFCKIFSIKIIDLLLQ
jgi:hypothetical protein